MTTTADSTPKGNMQRLLQLMASKSASDLYLSAHAPALLRIDGACTPINNQSLRPEAPLTLLAEIISAQEMQQLQASNELNISYSMPNIGRFHISAMRQRGSFAVTVHFVTNKIPSMESLSLPPILSDLILEKRGLILMVGMADSGKSTTLASMIEHRNANLSGHILTIEESMEFLFKNKRSVVNQREIGVDTESLQVALKNAMHQAPDVIAIDEIRDRETMMAAISCAQSGRLCLAKLHANNSFQAMNRIMNFFPPEAQQNMLGDLATSLRAIVSQRLLRTVTNSRTPVVEIILNTPVVAGMIERGNLTGIIEDIRKSSTSGSQTFEQDIARLIMAGIIEHKEGVANSDSPSNLLWHLQNDFLDQGDMANGASNDDKAVFTEVTLDITR